MNLQKTLLLQLTWDPMFRTSQGFFEGFMEIAQVSAPPVSSGGILGIFKKKPLQGKELMRGESDLAFQALIGVELVNLVESGQISPTELHEVGKNCAATLASSIRSYSSGARWKDVEEWMIHRTMEYAILMPRIQDDENRYDACQESRIEISKTLLRCITNNRKSDFNASDLQKIE